MGPRDLLCGRDDRGTVPVWEKGMDGGVDQQQCLSVNLALEHREG